MVMHSEFGLFTMGWVWMQRADLVFNHNHGWICVFEPVKHIRKVLENSRQTDRFYKGAVVRCPGSFTGYGTVIDSTLHENWIKVKPSIGNDIYLIARCDLLNYF